MQELNILVHRIVNIELLNSEITRLQAAHYKFSSI